MKLSFFPFLLLAVIGASNAQVTTTCTRLPTEISLKPYPGLPDPFQPLQGERLTTQAGWQCRRQEIFELFQRFETGHLPGPPHSLTATMIENKLSITATEHDKTITFNATIRLPTSGTAPFPAILALGGASIPIPDNVALITFNNDEMAQQMSISSRGLGKFYELYGSDHSASALTAWAWGAGRILDALEKTPEAQINPKRVGVTGCSRNGKGALTVGAFETRFVLTLPQESGTGGAGCWRLSDHQSARLDNVQTARQLVTENVWMSKEFEKYVNSTNTLPFDHHMLSGLVAPRGLYIMDHAGIMWLGPMSTFHCSRHGRDVYRALGVPNNMGISQAGDHSHCLFPASQQAELTYFIKRFLFGDHRISDNIERTEASFEYNDADWVNWEVPILT